MSNRNELAVNVETKELNLNASDIKQYIAPNATDKELYFFINIAKSYGLNPFKREIHFCKYGNSPGQVIVGYETYIKCAERTGLLDGWKVWFEKDQVGEKAVIEIYRKDRSYPFQWEVYRQEFDKKQSTWKAMPYFMLKKVAISQGFRLAFPEEIGGMPYTPDEINHGTSENLPKGEIIDAEYTPEPQEHPSQSTQGTQAGKPDKQSGNATQKPDKAAEGVTSEQVKKIQTLYTKVGYSDREKRIKKMSEFIKKHYGHPVASTNDLARDEASFLIEKMEEHIQAAASEKV
jgi:phage recombination protein Bet